jgi:hypothetical protein
LSRKLIKHEDGRLETNFIKTRRANCINFLHSIFNTKQSTIQNDSSYWRFESSGMSILHGLITLNDEGDTIVWNVEKFLSSDNVTSQQLSRDSVTSQQLPSNSVTSQKIQSSSTLLLESQISHRLFFFLLFYNRLYNLSLNGIYKTAMTPVTDTNISLPSTNKSLCSHINRKFQVSVHQLLLEYQPN